jgi:hypothetical protein
MNVISIIVNMLTKASFGFHDQFWVPGTILVYVTTRFKALVEAWSKVDCTERGVLNVVAGTQDYIIGSSTGTATITR